MHREKNQSHSEETGFEWSLFRCFPDCGSSKSCRTGRLHPPQSPCCVFVLNWCDVTLVALVRPPFVLAQCAWPVFIIVLWAQLKLFTLVSFKTTPRNALACWNTSRERLWLTQVHFWPWSIAAKQHSVRTCRASWKEWFQTSCAVLMQVRWWLGNICRNPPGYSVLLHPWTENSTGQLHKAF